MGWIKFSCVLLYCLALAGWAGMWTGVAADAIQFVVLLILGVHAIEVLLAFKLVRLYPGGLARSIGLTLLFGLVHLRPLALQARRTARNDREAGSHGDRKA